MVQFNFLQSLNIHGTSEPVVFPSASYRPIEHVIGVIDVKYIYSADAQCGCNM